MQTEISSSGKNSDLDFALFILNHHVFIHPVQVTRDNPNIISPQ